jgi:hypothetical protein
MAQRPSSARFLGKDRRTDSAICRQGKKCKTGGFPNRGERYGAKYENGVAYLLSYTVSVEKLWTQNTRIIHDIWRLLILSNEEKRMIMKILIKEWFIWKYRSPRLGNPPVLHFFPCLHMALSVRRSFPRNLAENSEAASFLGQTTSY